AGSDRWRRAPRLRAAVPRRALRQPLCPPPPRRKAGRQRVRLAARVLLVPDHRLTMQHIRSYYAASATPAPLREPLRGEVTAGVCVVGGGIAGCSTAVHLAERGYKVVLLEGKRIAWGASGRSGGQAIFGFAAGQ